MLLKDKEKLREYNQKYYQDNKKRWCERYQDNKFKVLQHYGLSDEVRCSWPGCSVRDRDELTIDHIKGNGTKHRKEIRRQGKTGDFYNWLIQHNFPDGFQTLCGGHQLKKRRKEYLESKNEIVKECPSCGTLNSPLNSEQEIIPCRCGQEYERPK